MITGEDLILACSAIGAGCQLSQVLVLVLDRVAGYAASAVGRNPVQNQTYIYHAFRSGGSGNNSLTAYLCILAVIC